MHFFFLRCTVQIALICSHSDVLFLASLWAEKVEIERRKGKARLLAMCVHVCVRTCSIICHLRGSNLDEHFFSCKYIRKLFCRHTRLRLEKILYPNMILLNMSICLVLKSRGLGSGKESMSWLALLVVCVITCRTRNA